MSNGGKPLPRPPAGPFGRGRSRPEGSEAEPLTADRMAQAMAEGRLEEFLDREVPDSPHARDLATMMLGMTGMLPPGGGPPPDRLGAGASPGAAAGEEAILDGAPVDAAAPAGAVPEELLAAVRNGDLGGVVNALRREHRRRTPGAQESEAPPVPAPDPAETGPRATIDRETLDAVLRIAAENGVTPDWITFRAIRLYVEEYRRTGRL